MPEIMQSDARGSLLKEGPNLAVSGATDELKRIELEKIRRERARRAQSTPAQPAYSAEHLAAAERFGVDPASISQRSGSQSWELTPEPVTPEGPGEEYGTREEWNQFGQMARGKGDSINPATIYEDIERHTNPMTHLRGAAGAAGRSLRHGALLGSSDEADGVTAMMASNPIGRVVAPYIPDHIKGGAGLGMELASSVLPKPDSSLEDLVSEREPTRLPFNYVEARDQSQARIEEGRTNYPVTSFGAEMAGGAFIPASQWRQGAPLAANAARQARAGAVAGAVYGGAEENGNRVQGATVSGAIGGVAGAALPVAGVGAGGVARKVYRTGRGGLARLQDALVKGSNAGLQHNERVALAAVRRSMERSGRTPEEIFELVDRYKDKPAVLADVIGQDAANTLTALTRGEGQTAQRAMDVIAERRGGMVDRVQGDIRNITGVDRAEVDDMVQGLVASARERASPIYRQAYDAYAGIDSDYLQQMAETGALSRPFAKAVQQLTDEAVAAQRDPANISRLEVWDLVKRDLDDRISAARAKGEAEAVRRFEVIRAPLVEHLDQLTNGAYAQAREAGSVAPVVNAARQQGSRALDAGPASQVRSQIAATPQQARAAYQGGVVEDLGNKIDRQPVPPRRFTTPANQEKLQATFGEQRGNQLVDAFRAEVQLAQNDSRWNPNVGSVTSQAQGGKVAGAADALADGVDMAAQIKSGGLLQNVGSIARVIARIARKSGYSEKQLDEIGDILLSDPEEGLRRLGLQRPARPSAPQSPPPQTPQTPPAPVAPPVSAVAVSPSAPPAKPPKPPPTSAVNPIAAMKDDSSLKTPPTPPSEVARQARLQEMGFDTENVLYHGTDQNFTEFKPSAHGELGEGVYLTPSAESASRYANIASRMSGGGDPAVLPVHIRGRIASEADLKAAEAVVGLEISGKKKAAQYLREQGFAGIRTGVGKREQVVIFDSADIRSVHAAADPAKDGSANLLSANGVTASGLRSNAAGIAGAGYGAANPQDWDGDGEITTDDRALTALVYGGLGSTGQALSRRVFSPRSAQQAVDGATLGTFGGPGGTPKRRLGRGLKEMLEENFESGPSEAFEEWATPQRGGLLDLLQKREEIAPGRRGIDAVIGGDEGRKAGFLEKIHGIDPRELSLKLASENGGALKENELRYLDELVASQETISKAHRAALDEVIAGSERRARDIASEQVKDSMELVDFQAGRIRTELRRDLAKSARSINEDGVMRIGGDEGITLRTGKFSPPAPGFVFGERIIKFDEVPIEDRVPMALRLLETTVAKGQEEKALKILSGFENLTPTDQEAVYLILRSRANQQGLRGNPNIDRQSIPPWVIEHADQAGWWNGVRRPVSREEWMTRGAIGAGGLVIGYGAAQLPAWQRSRESGQTHTPDQLSPKARRSAPVGPPR